MTAVHFTTIPCDPNTAHFKAQGKPHFRNFYPCTNNIKYAMFEFLELFGTFL